MSMAKSSFPEILDEAMRGGEREKSNGQHLVSRIFCSDYACYSAPLLNLQRS